MARQKKGGGDGGGGHSGTWFISYGDLVTLLMCFFIVLYAMSAVNETKWKKLAASTHAAFGGGSGSGTGSGSGGGSGGGSGETSRPKSQLEQMKDKVDTDIKNMGLGSNVKTQIDDQGLVIRLSTDEVVFPSASAALTPTATNFLMALSGMLRNTANEIKVEGHCDNVPIAPGYIYATNWELSTARASAVIRYFIEAAGLDATRMTAAGYADTRPRVPNDTPEHRAMNRRVEILISPLTQNKKTSSDSTSASSSSSSGESTSKGAKTTKSTQATKKESTKKK